MKEIKNLATMLFDLGFTKRSPLPGDLYELGNQSWIVGGKIFPDLKINAPSHVLKEGIWEPSTLDLWEWLIHNTDSLKIHQVNKAVPVCYLEMIINKTIINAKGAGMECAFFKAVLKVLLFKDNQPYSRRSLNQLYKKLRKPQDCDNKEYSLEG